MGRGRAKAKQTKVARNLKYRTFDPDFSDLQRELHGEDGEPIPDQYADLVEKPELAEQFKDRDAS
ncbi:MAG: DUF3073 family protein [Aeromicrobium sp.]|uniref:DUF3073 family protein n=1 Tax=Aeromicrobium sp. TaxID=1871063 RepID=UPI002614276B|nr:DUF3073 family protein [Aeromicrobium sp.]MDF1706265.1 DUF3073 family protein [Aeromicrobium sp.]